MSRQCMISGKKPLVGNLVSHAKNRTKTRQLPNLQWKKIFLDDEKRFVKIRISCHALRSINKLGLKPYLKKKGMTLEDISK